MLAGQQLMVATPCYGALVTEPYFKSMLQLALAFQRHNLPLEIQTWSGDSLVTRARNGCVARFLANPACTHLLFIDADIQFDPAVVVRMLELDKDVLCGIYPKKGYVFDWLDEVLRDRREVPTALLDYPMNLDPACIVDGQLDIENGCVRVLDAPTGFMMIRRRVFEAMIQAWPELHYRDNVLGDPGVRDYYALFEPMIDPETRYYLSEDFGFCRRWRQLGGEIWADLTIRLGHTGPATYRGDPLHSHFFDR